MEYTILRVSPGEKLSFAVDTEYQLTPHQMAAKGKSLITKHYNDTCQQVIADFCHTFINIEPKYALLVYAINVGYGLALVNYEAFIVKLK
jgi:hypothetical protein